MIYKIPLNGKIYEVDVEYGKAVLVNEYDENDSPAPAVSAAPAITAPAITSGEPITSPLPGNVFKINVTEGERVVAGQVLLVIEAMKMENEVLAPRDGTVLQIMTKQGATLNTGDMLIVLG